jgi:hypothetical protein
LEGQPMNNEARQNDLLERIRDRPPLFLGEHTITGLLHFLHGYQQAIYEHGIEAPPLLPRDFNDWAIYRLRFGIRTLSFREMILSQVPDEKAALDRFWELLDEYRARRAITVATIREQQKRDDFPPTTFSLVVYTDDPGFFVIADAPGRVSHDTNRFFPSLTFLLGRQWKSTTEFLDIFDQATLDRLIREDEELDAAASGKEARQRE